MEEIDAWLARDKNDKLFLFISERPRKLSEEWIGKGINFFKIKKERFPEVQWPDEEPTKVKLVIVK